MARKNNPFKKHFRINKKNNHPGLIIGENSKEYDSMKLTHSPYRAKNKLNEPLDVNPNPKDKKKAYIERRVRTYPKVAFGEVLKDLNLSEEDKKKIEKILSKYKK